MSSVSPETLKTWGNEAVANHEYTKAAKIYRDAINLDGRNPTLYSNRAFCFIKLEDWSRALRDCDSGLALCDEGKLKSKLLYRKGIALKATGAISEARNVFEFVVKADPNNKDAHDQLHLCIDSAMEDIIPHRNPSGNRHKIPIQVVDSLPQEYKTLINDEQPKNETINLLPSSSDAADKEINAMFGSTNKESSNNQEPPKQNPSSHTDFNQRSAMFPLTALTSLPNLQREKAYLYVVQLPQHVLIDTFKYGLEAEFLSFFIESASHVSETNAIDNWENKILESLKTLSSLKRYEMSLVFCNDQHIKKLLENVSNKNGLLVSEYKSYI